jgi:hypothetical protein
MSILKKTMIVEMCARGCDMAALFKVIHVIGEDDARLEIRKHALTTTLALVVRDEEPLTSRPIFGTIVLLDLVGGVALGPAQVLAAF